jgi:Flp pilus assembly protein TadG
MRACVSLKSLLLECRRYWNDAKGAAAAEFALILMLLLIPLLNAVDLATYAWKRMLVDNAAQVAAQAAWATCSASVNLPATPNSYANCPDMPGAVTMAARSTALGTGVTVTSTTENYYCVKTATSQLGTVGTFPGTKPANCGGAAGGLTADRPGDYVLITVSYTYVPVFSAVSVASLLTTPIVRTAWMRLG